ncbi:hypothetical protein TB2_016605 [Malus domestica]
MMSRRPKSVKLSMLLKFKWLRWKCGRRNLKLL